MSEKQLQSNRTMDWHAAAGGMGWHRRWMGWWLMAMLLALTAFGAKAEEESNALTDVSFSAQPGERLLITLTLEKPAVAPNSFTIDDPARIALDLPNTTNKLKKRNQTIGIGMARAINTVEAGGRTRVVVSLGRLVPYETRVEGNRILLFLDGGAAEGHTVAASTPEARSEETTAPAAAPSTTPRIESVDFRRGSAGEGRIVVTLSDSSPAIDMRQESGKIVVDFLDTILPRDLERRLDVTDFATPVQTIDTMSRGNTTRMLITPAGEYDHLAYQADNVVTIEVKPLSKGEKEELKRRKFTYTGERLTLNFQNIEVRAVLQLLADFTNLNMVVSDSVTGSLTLRLKNVPWDQALDIILKTRGLDKRQNGNVMLVAPAEEIAAREKMELESRKQVADLSPLRTEWFQINYAKAADLAALLKGEKNSLLSKRGSITIDERTNTLLIQDTSEKLEEIRGLVGRLDIPVRQVLIESRIVIASNDFSKDLGVRFGITGVADNGGDGIFSATGSAAANDGMVNEAVDNINNTGDPLPVGLPALDDRLMVDLPAAAGAPQVALAILGSNYLVDLELSAMQAEGRGEIISNPRLITSNQKEAVIKQGFEIPYQSTSANTGTRVQFKEAVLSLSVTPQITPDDRVIMDLTISKDTPDFTRQVNGQPPISTRTITTQVLVNNGETIVLGGIYEQTTADQTDKVPFFGDLPVVGHLFKANHKTDTKSELLLFVTPKIIKESLRVTP